MACDREHLGFTEECSQGPHDVVKQKLCLSFSMPQQNTNVLKMSNALGNIMERSLTEALAWLAN